MDSTKQGTLETPQKIWKIKTLQHQFIYHRHLHGGTQKLLQPHIMLLQTLAEAAISWGMSHFGLYALRKILLQERKTVTTGCIRTVLFYLGEENPKKVSFSCPLQNFCKFVEVIIKSIFSSITTYFYFSVFFFMFFDKKK